MISVIPEHYNGFESKKVYDFGGSLPFAKEDYFYQYTRKYKNEKIDCFISKRLIKRISSKQIVAYKNDIKKLNTDNIEEYNILEFYYRVRLIIDYISGMTDDFALEEYKILHAIK